MSDRLPSEAPACMGFMTDDQIESLRILLYIATRNDTSSMKDIDKRLSLDKLQDFRRARTKFGLDGDVQKGSISHALYYAIYRHFIRNRSLLTNASIRLIQTAYAIESAPELQHNHSDYWMMRSDTSKEKRREIAHNYTGTFWVFRYLEPRNTGQTEPEVNCALLHVLPPKDTEHFSSYRIWYRRVDQIGERQISTISGHIYPINHNLFWAGSHDVNNNPYLHISPLLKEPGGVRAFSTILLHPGATDRYMAARCYAMRVLSGELSADRSQSIRTPAPALRERISRVVESDFLKIDLGTFFNVEPVVGQEIIQFIANDTACNGKIPLTRL